MATSATAWRVMSIEDLEIASFSLVEIDWLQRLSGCYPYIEFTDTAQQWQRLVFLKWRMKTGHAGERVVQA